MPRRAPQSSTEEGRVKNARMPEGYIAGCHGASSVRTSERPYRERGSTEERPRRTWQGVARKACGVRACNAVLARQATVARNDGTATGEVRRSTQRGTVLHVAIREAAARIKYSTTQARKGQAVIMCTASHQLRQRREEA